MALDAEPISKRVLSGGRFAFVRARSGGMLGVDAVAFGDVEVLVARAVAVGTVGLTVSAVDAIILGRVIALPHCLPLRENFSRASIAVADGGMNGEGRMARLRARLSC